MKARIHMVWNWALTAQARQVCSRVRLVCLLLFIYFWIHISDSHSITSFQKDWDSTWSNSINWALACKQLNHVCPCRAFSCSSSSRCSTFSFSKFLSNKILSWLSLQSASSSVKESLSSFSSAASCIYSSTLSSLDLPLCCSSSLLLRASWSNSSCFLIFSFSWISIRLCLLISFCKDSISFLRSLIFFSVHICWDFSFASNSFRSFSFKSSRSWTWFEFARASISSLDRKIWLSCLSSYKWKREQALIRIFLLWV